MTEIIDLNAARKRRDMVDHAKYEQALAAQRGPPDWKNDIRLCCAYARLLRAEHDAENARIDFDLLREHDDCAWWEASDEIKSRVTENGDDWERYIALLVHIAALPAKTRSEAGDKRRTIGRNWLKPDVGHFKPFARMREGCLADDYLFPPSLRLERLKGRARVS